jgi:hypothetical protein
MKQGTRKDTQRVKYNNQTKKDRVESRAGMWNKTKVEKGSEEGIKLKHETKKEPR